MKFVCEECGESFESTRSDEDAMQESQQIFGTVPAEHLAVVCDECYRNIMAGLTQ